MTKAGKLEKEFAIFKKEVEARLAALETKKPTAKPKAPAVETESDKSIVIEAKDDIVAKDAE